MTLGAACDEFIALNAPGWRKHTLISWRGSLAADRCRALRAMPISAVTSADVINVIRPVAPVSQSMLLARLAKVFDWAAARGFVPSGFNPARFKIEHHLAISKHKVQHRAALPWQDAPAFMRTLQVKGEHQRNNEDVVANALMFQILTCTRPSESRNARWEEFDGGAGVWTILSQHLRRMGGRRNSARACGNYP